MTNKKPFQRLERVKAAARKATAAAMWPQAPENEQQVYSLVFESREYITVEVAADSLEEAIESTDSPSKEQLEESEPSFALMQVNWTNDVGTDCEHILT